MGNSINVLSQLIATSQALVQAVCKHVKGECALFALDSYICLPVFV